MLGIGYGLQFNYLFKFLKSLRKRTWFVFGLVCVKDGDPHSESFDFSINPNITKQYTSFSNIYPCIFGTGYGSKHISLAFYFNLKFTGSVFHVPSVTSNNFLIFCNKLSKKLCWSSVECWYFYFVTLFKFVFSYLESKIVCNHFLEVRIFFDSNTSSEYSSVKIICV